MMGMGASETRARSPHTNTEREVQHAPEPTVVIHTARVRPLPSDLGARSLSMRVGGVHAELTRRSH